MFTIIFAVLTALLASALLHVSLKLRRYQEGEEMADTNAEFWRCKWRNEIGESIQNNTLHECEIAQLKAKHSADISALEIGRDELEENYQAELLDQYDKVNTLENVARYWMGKVGELEQIRLDHSVYCLPRLSEDILDTESAEEEYEEDPPLYRTTVIQHVDA